ncbi:hypothetical protein QE152_g41106 [Popillia japonica]|uniref:Transposase n=1 Tax=Popillia japonica TaxID=7064 RepID=A0AAW1H621_POPJA
MLTAAYDKHPYPSDRVFNVDETGLTVVQTKIPHVIKLKGKRQVGAITSAERGSLVTVICCMSAGGTFVPPMMIFPRKNMTDTLMRGVPPASLGRCHPSGGSKRICLLSGSSTFFKRHVRVKSLLFS